MKFKRFLLPILVFGVSIVTLAFTQSSQIITTTNIKRNVVNLSYYFSYTGPSNPMLFDDYEDPDNYIMLSGSETPIEICESGSDALCTISCQRYWNGTEWKPDFSDTSLGNTRSQLLNYWMSGLAGTALYLKEL